MYNIIFQNNTKLYKLIKLRNVHNNCTKLICSIKLNNNKTISKSFLECITLLDKDVKANNVKYFN